MNFKPNKESLLYKTTASIFKIAVLMVLVFLFLAKIVLSGDKTQIMIGSFVLVFITLPTIWLIFFKKKSPQNSKMNKFWGVYRIFYAIIVILYIGFWIFGAWHLEQVAKTKTTIDFINSQKITLDDVMGKNLPPKPDQKFNDSTIAGIDANKNNIRDDVELAIFAKYPDSARIRSAELQYAQALQLELTQVFNSETLIDAMKKKSSSSQCITLTIKKEALSLDRILPLVDEKDREVENLVLNTDIRKQKLADIFGKFITSYVLSSNSCDIELTTLPN